MRLLALGAILLASGCFSLSLDEGQYRCGPGGECPGGLSCGVDGRCYHAGALPRPGDAGPADASRDAGPDGGRDVASDVPRDVALPDAGPLDRASDPPAPDAPRDAAGDPPADASPCGNIDCPPARSCAELLARSPGTPSGEYTLEPTPGAPVVVYCEMTLFGGGWARVIDFDVERDACPGDWVLRESPRVCHRNLTTPGARAAVLDVPYPYGEVMGYVRALQKGNMDSFDPNDGIDGVYVDGVSISVSASASRGGRTHVWTYAVAWSDDDNRENTRCPCLGGEGPPAFVGEHFYCESGTTGVPDTSRWYTDDPLWDGNGSGTDCDTAGDPSYFQRTLGTSTRDPLEVRLMADQDSANEDVGVYRMELYVR